MLGYLQKNNIKNSLVLVRNKAEANALSKKLKLKSFTTFNIHDYLSHQDMAAFKAPELLHKSHNN